MTIHDDYLDNSGRFLAAKAQPVGRLGGFASAALGEVFEMKRRNLPLEKSAS